MKKKITLVMLALVVVALGGMAQGRKSLRINEVMVANETSAVDEYGQHAAWIELFNSNFSPLQISSVFLTDDPANPTKYPVPLGDEKTKMGKRQTLVFWADGQPTKGTFHTSFQLTPGQDNWVGVYDADGITLIDSVTIPASLPADASLARSVDGKGEWTVRTNGADDYVTPGSANVIKGSNPKIKDFGENDKHGFAITLMAMMVVFSALLVLCLAFYGIGKIGKRVSRFNKARAQGKVEREEILETEHDSGEEIAAIVLALHEHLNAHDTENTILTINKVKRAYSPWSSKIYGLREVPRR